MLRSIEQQFKALGEPTRLKIVKLLSIREFCVCELVALMEMSQPRVSQHLKVLRTAGVAHERREGQRSFYRLAPEFAENMLTAFTGFMNAQLPDIPEMAAEQERLTDLEGNPRVRRCLANEDRKFSSAD